MNDKIYLDYAATTPLDEQVFEVMKPYFSQAFGNASSVHQFGQAAQKGVINARHQVAEFLNCQADEVIFISGATEGNNTVIKGIGGNKKLAEKIGAKPHIIISKIEHECILASSERLEKEGMAEVAFLPVNSEGLVEISELQKNIKPNTILVSIMYANNETGAVEPIEEIGQFLKKINQGREQKIYFHTDASQALNYLDCDVQKLGVDLLTLSGHKIYGPKGVGALFVRQGTPVARFMDGGEQEFKMRAGTHNTPGIVGLGAAISVLKQKNNVNSNIKQLRDKLINGVLKNIPQSFINGSLEKRLPNNANFRFEGVEGEAIIVALDLEGIAVSTGSACAARSLSPSHVLGAMGLTPSQSHSSVRFSLGCQTTDEQIEKVLEVLPKIIEKLRNLSGDLNESAKIKEKAKLPDDFGC
ncbi:MAG: cysteine desulfurase [Candidatus Portnoybacteria bacterium]|nr:cysteine desulfurase [Candidatus Portnoybacteria bacterium]